MSKRFLSLVLALVMVLGTLGTAVFAAGPTGNERVDKLIELGLVKGRDGDYALSESIRRDEVAAMVVRAMGLETVAEAMKYTPTKFKDVKAGEWNNGYVAVAEGEGITKGVSANEFAPARDITYAEVAAMMVRVLGAMTAEEEKTASWPATYIAKAEKLGIFKDVEMAATNAIAKRQQVFEMVFNTINNKNANLVIANTVEGIVVENYRTENINKDDVIVHVMKDQIQRTDSKYYEKDDEFKVTINKELKAKGLDVETLLGKVVTVSFDKDGKVVGIEINNDYDYVKGSVDEIDSKQIMVNGKWYTLGKEEGRTTQFDERLYQIYRNNEDIHLNKLDDVEYARITVRNGKVLFIDAYKFGDIAPVAKDINKDVVEFYNDAKDGAVDKLTVDSDAYVILFENDEMSLGNNEDIEKEDVIHWYYSHKDQLTVFVRPADDNKVEGNYTEANARRANKDTQINVRLDKKTDYPAFIVSEYRNPVFSTYYSEDDFQALSKAYDDDLAPFEGKDVVLLRDMFDYVQLIAKETPDAGFYAIIRDVFNYDFNLLTKDNLKYKDAWYDTDRHTEFKVSDKKITKESALTQFEKGDLVKVDANEDNLITIINDVTGEFKQLYKIDNNVIDFSKTTPKEVGKDYYYVSKNYTLFVNGVEAISITDFNKKYEIVAASGDEGTDEYVPATEAFVITSNRDDNVAQVIVIMDAKLKAVDANEGKAVVRVTRVRPVGSEYDLTVALPDGTPSTHRVAGKDAKADVRSNKIVAGDIIEATIKKDADKNLTGDITAIVELIDANDPVYKVVNYGTNARNERFVVLADASDPAVEKTLWLSKSASVFGGYSIGSYVALEKEDPIDAYNVIEVIYQRTKDHKKALWDGGTSSDNELPEGAVAFKGIFTLDDNKYIQLGDKSYPFVGTQDLTGFAEGDMVIPTFTTIRGETVVTKIEAVEVAPK